MEELRRNRLSVRLLLVICLGTACAPAQESPQPVSPIKETVVVLGGLGNVARNISSLGANVCVISVLGNDDAGGESMTTLAARA